MSGLALPKIECIESTEIYGCFVAEPLEKGFGVTLGNSFRRVILSSLLGAAVTWVEIEGIQHEFSTIPHIKEDTIDFLLNTRAVRLRPLSQRSGTLLLEVGGGREVLAGDIQPSADFEIANPEHHLATLDSSESRLCVRFNVEVGRGYMPASSSDSLPVIGALPVDAIFTPVRRVNYRVEPSELTDGGNHDKLILEIWTDGTLSPAEAFSQSATILMEQIGCFRELAKVLTEEGEELAWQRLIPSEQYNMTLDQLNLSTHTYNSLRRGSITTVGQILEKGIEGLCALAGFGAKSREEVEMALKTIDLPVDIEPKKKERKNKQSTSSASIEMEEEAENDSNIEEGMTNETSDSRTEAE